MIFNKIYVYYKTKLIFTLLNLFNFCPYAVYQYFSQNPKFKVDVEREDEA